MRIISCLVIAAALISCQQQSHVPNILMIVVDDLGYSDLSCYGNTLVETPVIDRMASEGIRFAQAYASCPVCSPTRAAILTGKNPTALNLTDWIPGHQANHGPSPTEKFIVAPFNQHLPLEEITIAELLGEAGYTTASIGKWHLGGDGYLPTDQGFDLNIAGHQKGSPPSYYYPYVSHNRPNGIPHLDLKGDSLYLTDRLTNEAIGFIRTRKEEPFFLYLPYYNVHTPLQGRPDLVRKYEAILADHRNDSILRNAEFLAMTEAVDDNIGRIMQCLEEEDLDMNTLVIFTSDNGMPNKNAATNAGSRVPMLIDCPGVVRTRGITDELVSLADILPTLVDFSGGRLPDGYEVDGLSLKPFLTGRSDTHRDFLFNYLATARIVRTKDWMLEAVDQVYDSPEGRLYDCRAEANHGIEVSGSKDPEVLEARKLLEGIMSSYPPVDTSLQSVKDILPEYDVYLYRHRLE